jgi:hypothetical protein
MNDILKLTEKEQKQIIEQVSTKTVGVAVMKVLPLQAKTVNNLLRRKILSHYFLLT